MMSDRKLRGTVTFLRSHRQQDTELAASPKGSLRHPAASECVTVALLAGKSRSCFTHSPSALARACQVCGLGGCSSLERRRVGGSQ